MATTTAHFPDLATLPALKRLWSESLGDPNICVAVLDGTVDQTHPCFKGSRLSQMENLVSGGYSQQSASRHGTHIASIIFGQHGSDVTGIAPNCRGLLIPIFTSEIDNSLASCSQIDLARAITQAVDQGANVINISGGQLTPSGEPERLLANAVQLCADNNVLIVAAAGNDGCDCLHVPAAIASVLAVGAMDSQEHPISFSNWGEIYQIQGILALGENILGAIPSGGTVRKTGTSFATPIVSGIVALLLSIQLKRGGKPDPHLIRDVLLKSALPCQSEVGDCRRFLVGVLNIAGAYALVTEERRKNMFNAEVKEEVMIQSSEVRCPDYGGMNPPSVAEMLEASELGNADLSKISIQFPVLDAGAIAAPATSSSVVMPMVNNLTTNPSSNNTVRSVTPSEADGECGCGGSKTLQMVYALGQLGTDFGSQTRHDSFMQRIPQGQSLLDYLNQNPWEAQSLIWTLNLDATPIYAIVPIGAYASITYDRLRSFLSNQHIERVSIPGYVGGSVRLLSGQVIPAIVPEVRGIYSWSVQALLDSLMQNLPDEVSEVSEPELRNRIREALDRIYYDFRNLGVTPQERALNFSATNAFELSIGISRAQRNDQVLDTIEVEKSPICRPDSDCYDVKLRFFNPENNQRARKIYRFTVDVSDVVPVTIGQMRSWSVV